MTERWYAWRAALRIARRDAWRNKGRSALIAIMVALPVLAVSAADVLWRSTQLDPQDVATVELGRDAQARVEFAGGGKVTQSTRGDNYGSEGGEPVSPAAQQAAVQRLLPPGDELVPDLQYAYSRSVRIGDRLVESGLREFDYRARGLTGLIEQVSGREPRVEGEVVMSSEFARRYEVAVGDRLDYRPPGTTGEVRPLVVVGEVGGYSIAGSWELIGNAGTFAPGSGAGGDAGTGSGDGSYDPVTQAYFVVGPAPVGWDQVLKYNDAGFAVTSRAVLADPPPRSQVPYEQEQYSDDGAAATAIGVGVVAVGLVLLQIALLAGPAIAVGARRNRRGLAIVAAGGGERRHLRAIVLATSGFVGLVGCTIAAGVGVVVGYAGILALRRWSPSDLVPRVDVHLLDLAGLVAVGAFTAVAASLVPARQAARMDIVDALTGRRGQAPPKLRVSLAGLLIAVAGGALAFYGAARHQALVTVIGIALGEIGLVVATGAMVALAARLAGRMPLPARFALRDAARQRGRTAPAVAAVMAAIAGSTAALLYVAAQDRHDELSYTPSSALGVASVGIANEPDGTVSDVSAAELESRMRRTLPIDRVAPLRSTESGAFNGPSTLVQAMLKPELACPVDTTGDRVPTAAEQATMDRDRRCTNPFLPAGKDVIASNVAGLMVDDGTALGILTGVDDRAASTALRAGRVVTFDQAYLWPDGTVHVQIDTYPAGGGTATEVRRVALPATFVEQSPRLPGVVVPPSALDRLQLQSYETGFVASTTRMPTDDEEDRAAAALEDAGGYLSVERGYQSSYAIGLLALVGAAVLITLGGTFTAVGLAAAEGRADHATLSAVGAGPGVRRRLAASQAGVIAGLGAALGLVSGFLAGWALIRLQQPSSNMVTMGGGVTYDTGALSGTWQLVVPWLHLAGVGIGVPLLTVLIGFLTTRSRLPLVRRLGQ